MFALAEPDGNPKVAAPNNIAAPSASESSFFMDQVFLSKDFEPADALGNDHAIQKLYVSRVSATALG